MKKTIDKPLEVYLQEIGYYFNVMIKVADDTLAMSCPAIPWTEFADVKGLDLEEIKCVVASLLNRLIERKFYEINSTVKHYE